jgi:hypothetical protein
MAAQERGVTTPESVALENLSTKISDRADKYIRQLEAITRSQERQAGRALRAARWAALAGWASAAAAAILALSTALSGDDRATSFARCQMRVLAAPSPAPNFLSVCMLAAGYRDTCGSPPGATPECFVPANLKVKLRDAVR